MGTVSVDIDIDDVLEEIDTDDLIEELETRHDLPPRYRGIAKHELNQFSKTPIRDAITGILKISDTSSLGDILQAVTDNFNK